jgi:hypothetical protein
MFRLNRNKQETNRNSLIGSIFCYFYRKVEFFLFFSVFSRSLTALLRTTGGTAGTLLGQPEMLHDIKVTQRTFPLGEQPGVDAGAVEVVGAGKTARLLTAQQRLQADGALAQPPLTGRQGSGSYQRRDPSRPQTAVARHDVSSHPFCYMAQEWQSW